ATAICRIIRSSGSGAICASIRSWKGPTRSCASSSPAICCASDRLGRGAERHAEGDDGAAGRADAVVRPDGGGQCDERFRGAEGSASGEIGERLGRGGAAMERPVAEGVERGARRRGRAEEEGQALCV